MGRRWALAALAMGILYPAVATAQDEEPRSSGGTRALTLREVVAAATKSNPDAIAAQARIDRAEADGSVASARYLPSLDANTVQDTLIFRNDHYTMSTTHAEGRVDLRWTLWDFGRTSSAVAAATASTESAEQSSKATKASIAQRRFAATASRTSSTNASSSRSSGTDTSMARRVPASRLALNSPAGSSSDAPRAKVTFTLSR